MSDTEVDLINRDPNELNNTVQVAFEDVLGEPESSHSIDCVWTNSHKCFTCGKNCCYKFMSTLCGLCIALYWGCEFAMITFNAVWCCTPSLKVYSIVFGFCQKFFGTCIACCLAPVCETIGLMFSKIQIAKS
ncbi:caveolin-1-like [Mizuhopecten yessoensis]|uniref:Caveolin n=1 Tax=Mizuhopecten yessoensis TaxID=6573 RepID=A0A210PEZ5_MIZYE|nr:caveolin-1-like [Mizuhopecten yessoensis]OWF35037.1 Caveolin-1 [Mizuhopecten yessoensis]